MSSSVRVGCVASVRRYAPALLDAALLMGLAAGDRPIDGGDRTDGDTASGTLER